MTAAKQLELSGQDQPAVTDLNGGILGVIARAAVDPNVDVDKLERLLAMQERVLAREAEQAFNDALRAAQDEIKPIAKNRINPETKSKYADLSALAEGLDPIIRKHGFAQSFGTADCPIPGHYRVTCDMSHSAGHTRRYQADVPVDNTGPKGSQNKTMTHGFGSALSYGRRYLKLLIADVPTTDDDGRAAGRGQVIDDAQLATLQQLASASGADLEKFCKYYRIGSLPELPAAKFEDALKRLQQKIRTGAGQ
jgi:ERF superfamily